jgi:hypothetical protein
MMDNDLDEQLPQGHHVCLLKILLLHRFMSFLVVAVAVGCATVAKATPASLAPPTPECPHVAPIYQQDNKSDGHITRHVSAYRLKDSDAVFYESGLAIDADGAPNAYHPSGSPPGLDSLAAAGYPRSCSVLVCTGHSPTGGHTYAKTSSGPFDGFFVSMSTLMDERTNEHGKPLHATTDYRRYVDSTVVPYIAVAARAMRPFKLQRGISSSNRPGELAYVVNLQNGKASPAIFADVGTNNTLGEGSMALAKALGLSERQQSPTHGGVAEGILTIIFPGTAGDPPWPRDASEMANEANKQFDAWGGLDRVKHCFPNVTIP